MIPSISLSFSELKAFPSTVWRSEQFLSNRFKQLHSNVIVCPVTSVYPMSYRAEMKKWSCVTCDSDEVYIYCSGLFLQKSLNKGRKKMKYRISLHFIATAIATHTKNHGEGEFGFSSRKSLYSYLQKFPNTILFVGSRLRTRGLIKPLHL